MDTVTIAQAQYLLYEYLMSQAEELEIDSDLESHRETIHKDIANFKESYPEIVSEYEYLNSIEQ